MPKTVEKAVAAVRLAKGMQFKWLNQWWGIDEAPITKTRYVYVDVGNEEPFRFPLEAQILVRVEEPTAREEYDKALSMIEGKLLTLIMGAPAQFRDARRALMSSEDPGYWEFERYISARKQYRIYNTLRRIITSMDASDLPFGEILHRLDPGDLISALEDAIKEVSHEVWRFRVSSTSAWANAQGITENDTAREWVDQFRPELDYLQGLAILVAKEEAQSGD